MSPTAGQPGRLVVGLAGAGQLLWAAADLTPVVEEARQRLDLAPVPAVAFGRIAAGAALLLRMSAKTPRRLEIEVRGDGPLGRLMVEAGSDGGLRGLVDRPHVAGRDGAHDLRVGPVLGKGLFKVRRYEPDGRTYESQVALETGEIATDLAHYLRQSEQRRSAVLAGVLADPSGIVAAGGMIVEAFPGTEDEVVRDLERRIAELGSVSRGIAEDGIDRLVEEIVGEWSPQAIDERELRYRCRCRRDRLALQLQSLTPSDVAELVDERGLLDAECAYCGQRYEFSVTEILGDRVS